MIEELKKLARMYLDVIQNPPKLWEVPDRVIQDIKRSQICDAFATFIKDHPRVSLEDYFVSLSEEKELGRLNKEGRETLARRVICDQFAAAVKENIGYIAVVLALGDVRTSFRVIDHKTIGEKLLEAAVIDVLPSPLDYSAMKKYMPNVGSRFDNAQ